MAEPGSVFSHRRDPTPEELLVEDMVETFTEDLQALVDAFMPDGRPPFTVPLTKAETLERLMTATPPDWQNWLAQLDTIPDPAERRKMAAELFEQWAGVQTAQAGLGPQVAGQPEGVV